MVDTTRYTSGRIAIANLGASIDGLERHCAERATFEQLVALSRLLFVRGDTLGRIADHDRAASVATEAADLAPDLGAALCVRARIAQRFHRFREAGQLLEQAASVGHSTSEIDAERASLLQATGRYDAALVLRERLAKAEAWIDTLGALASLLAEMGRWAAAESCYAAALEADTGISPLPCAQLLFEWGVSAMRRGELERADELFAAVAAILPAHVPARGHRAEVALALDQSAAALALIVPLVEASDDPEYRAVYAEILAARGHRDAAAREAQVVADAYERLLARRPEAYADHAAAFFMGIGNCPRRALELATSNWKLRDTPRSRSLLTRALHRSRQEWTRAVADAEIG
jgi:tetratricopeptide (TPR) repeat protein